MQRIALIGIAVAATWDGPWARASVLVLAVVAAGASIAADRADLRSPLRAHPGDDAPVTEAIAVRRQRPVPRRARMDEQAAAAAAAAAAPAAAAGAGVTRTVDPGRSGAHAATPAATATPAAVRPTGPAHAPPPWTHITFTLPSGPTNTASSWSGPWCASVTGAPGGATPGSVSPTGPCQASPP